MRDDKTALRSDRKFISLQEGYELRDWMKALNATEPELRSAIKAVGNQPANVREYLKKKLASHREAQPTAG